MQTVLLQWVRTPLPTKEDIYEDSYESLPAMHEDGILVAKQSMTWESNWSHELQHSTLAVTGFVGQRCPIWLVGWSCQALSFIWLSQMYSSDCYCGKQTSNPFYLRCTRKQWLKINQVEKHKIFSILSMTLNYIWWWGSSSWA